MGEVCASALYEPEFLRMPSVRSERASSCGGSRKSSAICLGPAELTLGSLGSVTAVRSGSGLTHREDEEMMLRPMQLLGISLEWQYTEARSSSGGACN